MTVASPRAMPEDTHQMVRSKFQQLFSRTAWRRWLEKIRQFEEVMDMTELDFLERRVRSLEAQVSELRAQVGKR
jgi:polyhydroxyalkanoate synthesis regulator phasin